MLGLQAHSAEDVSNMSFVAGSVDTKRRELQDFKIAQLQALIS